MHPSSFPPPSRARFALQLAFVTLACASDKALGQCQGLSFEIIPAPVCPIFGPMAMGSDAIAENGVVCGTLVDCSFHGQPYLWTGKEVKIIVTPSPYLEAWANDANSAGQVVGLMSDGNSKAFLYTGNQVVNLGTLSGGSDSEAMAINENGLVVGWSTAPGALRAVKWENGRITQLSLPIGPSSTANDVNDRGQIVGWMGLSPGPFFSSDPFVWHEGKTTTLECLSGAVAGDAWAINNRGTVIIHCWLPSDEPPGYLRRSSIWSNGSYMDVPLLDGCTNSLAVELNDYNMVLANCWGDVASYQFLWWDGAMIDYLKDIPEDLGLTIFGGGSINNAGQILGEGLDKDHNPIAFILTPIPSAPGDFDCNKLVDVDDLLGVINSWNITGGGPADFNGDKTVGIDDVLVVLDNWTM